MRSLIAGPQHHQFRKMALNGRDQRMPAFGIRAPMRRITRNSCTRCSSTGRCQLASPTNRLSTGRPRSKFQTALPTVISRVRKDKNFDHLTSGRTCPLSFHLRFGKSPCARRCPLSAWFSAACLDEATGCTTAVAACSSERHRTPFSVANRAR